MSKKTARILWFFVLPVVALMGCFFVGDTYIFGFHWNSPVLGWIMIAISAIAFFGVIAYYKAHDKNLPKR
jgi:hypothetical protein